MIFDILVFLSDLISENDDLIRIESYLFVEMMHW